MSPQIADEETPLLADQSQHQGSRKKRTPLPWRQFGILLLLQISEPMTIMVIAPFLPQLIRDIGVTQGKESRVGYYVGLMHSLFFLTEACTIFHWSRLSDKVGRKPVLLIGLFGLSLSMWGFGLSKTFMALVICRCLNGALNGNVGVMKSMVMELTDPTNIGVAFSVMPLTWSLGLTLGPLIGGSLAKPAERFPNIFGNVPFFKEYPYFLPCAVPAFVAAFSWLVALLFLKESAKAQMSMKQYLFGWMTKKEKPILDAQGDDTRDEPTQAVKKPLPLRDLLTRRVIVAAGSYATYSLIDIGYRAIMPVFYAMPVEIGGLGLDPPAIGNILAAFGVAGGIIQFMCFSPMHDWLGPKIMFFVNVSLCIPVIVLFPVINLAARMYGVGYFVWCIVGFQILLLIFSGFTFGITFMYIGASAPNKESIGATNGLAQTIVSVMRAIGPAVVNSALSYSIEKNILGGYLAYWVMGGMVALTLWVGSKLPKKLWDDE